MFAVGQGQVAALIGPVGAPAHVALTATVSLEVSATLALTMSLEVPVVVAPSAVLVIAPALIVPAPTTPSGPSVQVPHRGCADRVHGGTRRCCAVCFSGDCARPYCTHSYHAVWPVSGSSLRFDQALCSFEVPGSTPTVRRPTIRFHRQTEDTVAVILTGVQALLVAQNKRFDAHVIMIQDLHSDVRDLRHQLDAAQALNRRAVGTVNIGRSVYPRTTGRRSGESTGRATTRATSHACL
ncbi:hypothetical protein DPMN_094057 [Dreissena polymorpha]|uniref:Uncharacterized protein n=1 Tax=Dreissena polymorpha TaxID=45954 RepID=A0A9D4L521_DREPO|nr:hypothetical protein DPMN_094057 [Dreissena polymorpha]